MGDILKVWDEENSIWVPIPAIQGAPGPQGPKGDKGDTGDFSPLDAYPVGAFYISEVSTSPAELFGGSWTQITGQFLFATDTTENDPGVYVAGSTGGAAAVTLTADEIPAHTHNSRSLSGYMRFRRYGTSGTGANIALDVSGIVSKLEETWSGSHALLNIGGKTVTNPTMDRFTVDATHTHDSVGGGAAHNNMPPYVAVYVWKRVS